MNKETALALAIGSVIAATLVGERYGPRPGNPGTAIWYAGLKKPPFTPPPPVIGAAWSVLDGLLCVAGYRLLTSPASPARDRALAAWGGNVAGIAGWQWLFFGRKSLRASLAAVTAMFGNAIASVRASGRVDRVAAGALAPLAGWIGFAALLNEELWRRNA